MQENPDKYYKEIAKDFQISKSQIHRILQKLGYTHKNNNNI